MAQSTERSLARSSGASRAWTSEEDALFGRDTDERVAARIDRTHAATANRREALGIRPFVKRWAPAEDKLLGTMPDAKLAAKLGRSLAAIIRRRCAKGRLKKPRAELKPVK